MCIRVHGISWAVVVGVVARGLLIRLILDGDGFGFFQDLRLQLLLVAVEAEVVLLIESLVD